MFLVSGVCAANTDGLSTLEFSATATKVAVGRTTTLRWNATNVSACVGSGAWNREYTGVRARAGSAVSAALTERNNEFVMTCIGAGGASITRSVAVTAVSAPTLTLKASDETPNPNQPVTLTWETTDADSCTASGSWTGVRAVNGTESLANLTKGLKTYSMSCRGLAGTVRSSVRLNVVAVPVVTFTASVASVPVGKNVTLRWSAKDAAACTAAGDWSGAKPRSGSESIGPLTKAENTFSISCAGPGGEDSASVTVGVVSAPTVNMIVEPAVIKPGESATVSWSSTDSESCRASLGWTGAKPTSGSESVEVFTKGKKTYSLSCRGAAGTARGSVELQVVPSPALNLRASATEIAAGRSTSLRWSSTNATSCTASGAWSGSRSTSGSVTTEPLAAGDNSFTLLCEGPNGDATQTVVVRALAAPTVELNVSAEVVAPGEGITLDWESADARTCIGGGVTTTAAGTGSPLSVGGLVNGTPYVCDVRASNSVGAGPYSSTRSATPTGVEVSGSIVLAGPLQVDSDTNDVNATTDNGTRASNNSFATAQALFAPFVLGGYVTLPGLGPSGAVRVAGDTTDIYRVSLRANQIVSLQTAARTPAEGDLDLFLYTAPGAVMSRSSTTTSRLETVVVPSTGEYFIEVRAFAGSSRYLLEVSDAAGAAAMSFADGAEQGLFVEDEAIIVPRVRSATQLSGGISRSGAGSLTLSATDAAGVAETLEVLASRSSGAVRVRLGDVMNAAQRTRKGVNAMVLPAGASFASGEQERRLRTVLRIKEISRDPNVLSAEPNYLAETTAIPGGSGYARQRWHYDLLRAPAAWDVGTGGSNVTVAIVDSGVSPHPDVSQNLLAGYDFVTSDLKGDGDGRDADASDPGVFASNDRGASARRHSHGTHVAGTAAARFTGASKVSGVAGGSRILPVRVLDAEGVGSSWDIADGIRYAAGLGTPLAPRKADVINLSLRGTGSCPQSIQSAITEARSAGVTVVAAAGNDGRSALGWPANCDGVIAVGAVDPRKSLATYSNFGSQLDLVAPGGSGQGIAGEDVYSSDIERIGTGGATYIERAIAGTSMAAPHVAGLIALMKQAKPDLTPTQVDNLLASGSMTDDLGAAGKDAIFGNGLANAYKAVVNANSSSANSSARIYTSTSALNFGDSYTSWDLYVTLVGLEEVLVSASSSQSWIQIATPTFVDARTLKYTITVNRNILADGFHDGTIVFSPSAGPQVTVSVSVTKRSQTVSGKLGFQYALLVDAASLNTIYQVSGPVAGAETSFTFSNVSAGRYFLIAGSDLDNDGFICGAAEACAYYPLTSDPEALEVDALVRGIKIGSLYLPLALTSSVEGGASLPIDGAPLEGFPVTPGRTPATASSRQRLLPAALPASGMQLRPGVVVPSVAPTSTPSPAQVITSTALVIEGPSITAAASTPPVAEISATVVSEVVDLNGGGEYLARETRVAVTGERDWVLEYRSQGTLLGAALLSRTMDVLWRAVDGAGISLPSSTWTQVCDGQVWSAQDGYQLIVGARARGSLQTAWEGEIASFGAAAVTHLTGVACAGSKLTLQGYAFELGPRDPALMTGPIKSQRFMLALDDRGNVITRSLREEMISISTLCSGAVAEERARFCAVWRGAAFSPGVHGHRN